MADDDTTTTCHVAMPSGDEDLAVLVVSTDGEGFVSTFSLLTDFPDGSIRDLFEEGCLVTDADGVAPGHFVLSEGTGRILEIVGAEVRETAHLRAILGGIHATRDGSLFAYGPDGRSFVRRSGGWQELPRLRDDILSVRDLPGIGTFASGGAGLFARLTPAGWEEFEIGTDVALNDICPLTGGRVLVVGMGGFAGYFSNDEWEDLQLPALNFYSAADFRGEIFIGAGPDGLGRLNNGTFEVVKENVYAYTLRASERYLGIAGENEVVRYDGSQFPYMAFEEDIGD